MLRKVRAYIEEFHLLTDDKPIIVGVSGGADSVALLSVLCDLNYQCIAAHCNFHLRGSESDHDEAFVRTFTSARNIPYYKIDFDTESYAEEKHISIEMAARELRYQWFEQLRVSLSAQAIAVAHHEQDNVETVLLNLIRGTGIKGLTGMQPKNEYVVRPLLSVKRNDILAWLEHKDISYVTDSTNLSDEYTRNFIRLKIIPLLEEINPSVSEAIIRTAENLTDAEKLYASSLSEYQKKVLSEDHSVLIEPLLNTPAPKTVLYEILKSYGFNRSVVNDIYLSLSGESGKRFYSSTHQLLKDRDRLFIVPLAEPEKDTQCLFLNEQDREIQSPIKLSLRNEVIIESPSISKEKNIATLDRDKLQFPLCLRRWKEGDWFIPFGMKGRKKLSDYFTDRKLSLFEKEKIRVLCSGENIVWIVGERIDNRFCVDKNSKEMLIIQFFD
ncbi:tRNA lysidine(34) synthetase TilS [Massilibacteroides sp.]|uniref:tRNA lysidine(34) synthetase TilS n=1 Tax=Massilibacteroides sp. TaxID=2034766 RepID=UPI00261FDDBE|nr:tRNA lysidine(34) synthetase TilS [Massilibacteroides sp.]MDD4515023.1 tRNA lysidine(34) synthetase TilS [Massilibacteroides sp.]